MVVAEVVSVGTELLMGQIADTNAQEIGKRLPSWGIAHLHRQTVGDNLGRLTGALQLALSRSDIVFTIGGLGPTQDDLTRDGIAAALNVGLVRNAEIEDHVKAIFEARKMIWLPSQNRQALLPEGSIPIPNANGTAAGIWMDAGSKVVIALPGPRNEFLPMLDWVGERLIQRFPPSEVLVSRLLRICGLGESLVEDRLGSMVESENPTIAPYAKLGEVHLRLTCRAKSKAEADVLLDPLEREVCARLHPWVYGSEGVTLEAALLGLLHGREETLAVAESLTGGLVSEGFVSVPGASSVFLGGMVTYQSDLKREWLGLDPGLLQGGPVQAEVALAMAQAIRERAGSTWGIATTGNAGPDVEPGGQPVGKVFLACVGPNQNMVEEHQFRGSRETIRTRAARFALTLLYKQIVEAK